MSLLLQQCCEYGWVVLAFLLCCRLMVLLSVTDQAAPCWSWWAALRQHLEPAKMLMSFWEGSKGHLWLNWAQDSAVFARLFIRSVSVSLRALFFQVCEMKGKSYQTTWHASEARLFHPVLIHHHPAWSTKGTLNPLQECLQLGCSRRVPADVIHPGMVPVHLTSCCGHGLCLAGWGCLMAGSCADGIPGSNCDPRQFIGRRSCWVI